jgi:hypothetical protein
MSKLMRMAYGRGGTRLEGILMSSSHVESAADPRWLSALLLAAWLGIPLLVAVFAIPKTSNSPTVIDISRVMEKTPIVAELPVRAEQHKVEPIMRSVPLAKAPAPAVPEARPAAKPVPSPPAVQKTAELQKLAPLPETAKPVPISRPAPAKLYDGTAYQPKVVRERLSVIPEPAGSPGARLRRDASFRETPSTTAGAAITRTRAVAAAGLQTGTGSEPVAAVRHQPAGEFSAQGGGGGQRLFKRGGRPAEISEGNGGTMLVASRERGKVARSGDVESTAAPGLARGVALSSLEICSSPQAEEDAIRGVLSVVGSRQSCADGKGEFQFKGTQRISSFNLIIFPAKGRRPANRCEELENAHKCLKTR